MSEQFSQPDPKEATAVERRDAPRYAFICPVELTDLRGDARITARTVDLSLHGCYIDTLNPFPEGTRVRLRLTKNDRRLELQARVTCCHVGSGMGLVFEQATSEQTGTLVSWLQSTSSHEEASVPTAPPAAAPQNAPREIAQFAAKLLKILEQKGILTRSESAEILRELNH
jgi:hypothetical protein